MKGTQWCKDACELFTGMAGVPFRSYWNTQCIRRNSPSGAKCHPKQDAKVCDG